MRALDRIFRRRAISQAVKKLVSWNPASLFSAGEQGVYFDPNNSATLFEDAAGTIPTALERPVGLMLDQSKGLVLGSELVANGGFSNASGAGWVKFSGTNADFSNSSLKISGIGSFTGYYTQITVSSYTWYKLVGTVVQAAPAAGINITPVGAGSGIASITSTGNGAVYFNSGNNTSLWVYCNVGAGYTAEYDNISVRELPGNHATSSSTARPTLTRRVNLLSNTEAFNNATWGKSTVIPPTITAAQAQSPIGSQTADKIALPAVSGANAFCVLFASPTQALSTGHKFSVYLKGDAGGEVVWLSSFGVAYTSTQCILTTEWQKFTLNFTTSASGVQYVQFGVDLRDASQSAKGAQTIYAWGADLRPANIGVGLPAYQRVGDTPVNAADYDTTGFPAWLRCSSGQSMVTPSINFTGTDKMTVWAGARKLSDSTIGTILEVGDIGAVTNGVSITAPQATATGNYGFQSGGTTLASVTGATYAAPISNVLAGIGNVSGPNATLRVNGAQAAISSASQGTGNFGNYPLYLFARNQASLFFNGLAGPIIVRGAQSSAAEIANAENWINAQQKVYQPPKLIFTALDSTGVSYPILDASMDSSGSTYTIPATVLDSAGTSYNLI